MYSINNHISQKFKFNSKKLEFCEFCEFFMTHWPQLKLDVRMIWPIVLVFQMHTIP